MHILSLHMNFMLLYLAYSCMLIHVNAKDTYLWGFCIFLHISMCIYCVFKLLHVEAYNSYRMVFAYFTYNLHIQYCIFLHILICLFVHFYIYFCTLDVLLHILSYVYCRLSLLASCFPVLHLISARCFCSDLDLDPSVTLNSRQLAEAVFEVLLLVGHTQQHCDFHGNPVLVQVSLD